jgi:hypothetical protein
MTAVAAPEYSPSSPKYPDISIRLVGEDGNGFFIVGRTLDALRRGGVDAINRNAYRDWAMDGDYNHLLWVTMCTVNTDEDEEDEFYDD